MLLMHRSHRITGALPASVPGSLAGVLLRAHAFGGGSYTKDQNLADATRLGEMLASLNRLPFPTVALVQVRACVCKWGRERQGELFVCPFSL